MAVAQTYILKPPQQLLSTFGQTNIHYYLLTEPVYSELEPQAPPETVLREGHVIAERPKLVTPLYMQRLEGFGADAQRYFQMMAQRHGDHAPGLLYTYKNEPKELTILADALPTVAERISAEVISRAEPRTAIIRGLDEMWDVSLFKFIYELTERSLSNNVFELQQRGLMGVDNRGLPNEARMRIEHMFWQVRRDELDPSVLKTELDRWDLFEDYQDRFFDLIRQR
ncbi:hypothetical protein DGWBC_0804 [Dehalogenimonas sp. WBC-2]|nr:hypothetical protein DGWBC_0804 [Dehalogenimonas sp. WBC-2]